MPPDPEGGVSKVRYAVVYVPRRSRSRFAANCVEIMDSVEQAQASSDPDNKKYAAKILGPSKSSEGQFIYYLLKWL